MNLAKSGVIIANISCSEAVLHLKFISKSSNVKSPSDQLFNYKVKWLLIIKVFKSQYIWNINGIWLENLRPEYTLRQRNSPLEKSSAEDQTPCWVLSLGTTWQHTYFGQHIMIPHQYCNKWIKRLKKKSRSKVTAHRPILRRPWTLIIIYVIIYLHQLKQPKYDTGLK